MTRPAAKIHASNLFPCFVDRHRNYLGSVQTVYSIPRNAGKCGTRNHMLSVINTRQLFLEIGVGERRKKT